MMDDRTRPSRVIASVLAPVVVLAGSGLLMRSSDVAARLSANPWSRLLTIESVVERGTLAITGAPLLHNTIDKIKVRDDFYSDKPPTLSVIGALAYWPLHATGHNLSPAVRPDGTLARPDVALFWITWVLCGWSLAAGIYAFRASLLPLGFGPIAASLMALACAGGSLLVTYVVTVNNHTVAAALVAGLWAVLLGRRPNEPLGKARCFLLGLLAGLTAAVDMPTGGAVAVCTVVYLVLAGGAWRHIGWCLLGAAGPAAVHCLLQMQVTPLPLPAQVQREYWIYPGSYWNNPAGYDLNQEPAFVYLGHLLVGPRGWLTVTPLAVWGLVSIACCALAPRSRWKAEARLAGAVVVVLVTYYAFLTGYQNYGGDCWGVRWFIAFTPPVLFFSCLWYSWLCRLWRGGPAAAKAAAAVGIGLFWCTALVSFAYAAWGTASPWAAIEKSTDPIIADYLQKLVVLRQ